MSKKWRCSNKIQPVPTTEYYRLIRKTKLSLTKSIINQIAKNLYLVFDLKALEKVIFVPTTFKRLKPLGSFKAFGSATDEKKKKFYLQSGKKYREKEREHIDTINSKPTKKNRIIVRTEEIDPNLLAEKTMDHLEIALKAFFPSILKSTQHLSVTKSFAFLVSTDYEKDPEDFEQLLRNLRYWKDLNEEIFQEILSSELSSIEDYMDNFFENTLLGTSIS